MTINKKTILRASESTIFRIVDAISCPINSSLLANLSPSTRLLSDKAIIDSFSPRE